MQNAKPLYWLLLAGACVLFGGMPAWAGVIAPFNADAFLASALPPKIETVADGFYILKPSSIIYGSPGGVAETMLQADIERMTGMRLTIQASVSEPALAGVVIKTVKKSDLPVEGFSIEIKPSGVTITGADARGCLFGVYALQSRIVKSGNVWQVACGTLKDWPELRIRGMCLEMLRPPIRDVSILKRYVAALSRARCNTIIFYQSAEQIDTWRRGVDDGGWTKAQIREVAAYARSLHMDVWGGMTSRFDEKKFPGMNLFRESNQYNPFDNASYRVLYSLYDEILSAYSPKTLLVGHDEIEGLNLYSDRYRISSADIMTRDVNTIRDWLFGKGVRTAIWGDMLLEAKTWGPLVGDTNSQVKKMRSGATHEALRRLAKDVVILDWHYAEYMTPVEYRSIDYFAKQGFTVVGSPYYKATAANLMAQSARKYNGAGLIGTQWGFGVTLSPASTTLYTLLSSWSPAKAVAGDGDDIEALAQMARPEIYKRAFVKQKPLELETFGNRSLKHMTFGEGFGIFHSAPTVSLDGIPLGQSVMGGIRFMIAQTGNNVVAVSQTPGSAVPTIKKETIIINQRADTVAFLQTAYISLPRAGVAPIGEYEIVYETGRKLSVPLQENYNITDIRTSEGLRQNSWTFSKKPDVLIGSTTGWRGSSATGMPLNLQAFLWSNPYPGEAIKTIALRVQQADRAITILLLGLTLL